MTVNGNKGPMIMGAKWRLACSLALLLLARVACAAQSGPGTLELVSELTDEWRLMGRPLLVEESRVAFPMAVNGGNPYMFDLAGGQATILPRQKFCYDGGYSATRLADGRYLLAGGAESGGSCRKIETALWQPLGDEWSDGPPLVQSRSRHTATLLDDGSVLFAGGVGGDYKHLPLASAERFDGTRVVAVAPMHAARAEHTATRLKDGRVLVIGGVDADGNAVRVVEIWDPAQGLWHDAQRLPTARKGHTAHLLPDGRVLVVGGTDDAGFPVRAVDIWSPGNEQWVSGRALPVATRGHAATLLASGDLLLVLAREGCPERQGPLLLWRHGSERWEFAGRLAQEYNWGGVNAHLFATTDGSALVVTGKRVVRWRPVQGDNTRRMPFYPERTAMEARLPDGRVMLAGERVRPETHCTQDRRETIVSGAVEFFDPARGVFTPGEPLNAPRLGGILVALGDGRVIAVGGHGRDAEGRDVDVPAEVWEPATGEWRLLRSELRTGLGEQVYAAELADGRVLFFFKPGGTRANLAGLAQTRAVMWDPASDLTTVSRMESAALGGDDAVVLRDGRILYTAGIGNQGVVNRVVWDSRTNSATRFYLPASAPGAWLGFQRRDGRVMEIESLRREEGRLPARSPARLWDPGTGQFMPLPDLPAAIGPGDRVEEADDGSVYVEAAASRAAFWLDAEARAWSKTEAMAAGPDLSASLKMLDEHPGDGVVYLDRRAKAWKEIVPEYVQRVHPAVVPLRNGSVMVAGGDAGGKRVQIWNPANNAWQEGTPLPRPYGSLQGVTLPSGRVLVVGKPVDNDKRRICDEWTPDDGQWIDCGSDVASGPLRLAQFDDGRAFILERDKKAAIYDEVKNTWVPANVEGGEGGAGVQRLQDPVGDQWVDVSALALELVAERRHALALANGELLTNDVTLRDPRSGAERVVDPAARVKFRASENLLRLPDGCILGWSPFYLFSADAQRLSPLPGMVLDVSNATALALSDGTVLFAGTSAALSDSPGAGFARIRANCGGVTGLGGSVGGMDGARTRVTASLAAAPATVDAPRDEVHAAAPEQGRSSDLLSTPWLVIHLAGLILLAFLVGRHGWGRGVAVYALALVIMYGTWFGVAYMRPGDEPPARDPCDFVGLWSSERGSASYMISLQEDGHFTATPDASAAPTDTGTWQIEGNKIRWIYDGRPGIRDVNEIVPGDDVNHFSLIEMNGKRTFFIRIEDQPAGSCKDRGARKEK